MTMPQVRLMLYVDDTEEWVDSTRTEDFNGESDLHQVLGAANVLCVEVRYTDGSFGRLDLVHPGTGDRFDVRADTYTEGVAG